MTIEIIKQLPEYRFDFDEIKKDVLWILEKNNNNPQIGLTHSNKKLTEEQKILECTGSIYNYSTNQFNFDETDFSIFNESYKSTALYEMYKSIPNVGRFRIMTMDGPKCYTIHQDLSMRYHYAIDTNPNCLFLFPGMERQIHIPCDQNLYILETRYKHTFVNGSKKRRIHIVIDDLSSLINYKELIKWE